VLSLLGGKEPSVVRLSDGEQFLGDGERFLVVDR